MEDRKLDTMIEETLEQQASRISMSPERQRKIKQSVRNNKIKEESRMRHISKRKGVLAAAVMCVLMSIVAVAGGKAVAWVSGSSPNNPDISTFADMKKAEDYMGAEIQAVETFSNGLTFDRGFLETVEEWDENNQVVGTFPNVILRYKKGSQRANMSLNPLGQDESSAGHAETQTIAYNGVNLTVTKDNYKFVPVNYKVTPEEQAAMDAGQLYVSYGSDQVEETAYYCVSWDNGLSYLLAAFSDDGLSAEDLVQMAKEIVDAE